MEDDEHRLRLELVKEIGLLAYKFLITLNSGAFIVLLTFIGNVSGDPVFTINLGSLRYAMYFFLAAILLTFVGMTVTYVSAQKGLQYQQLPIAGTFSRHLVWLVGPVAFAFIAFLIGVVCAIEGIS